MIKEKDIHVIFEPVEPEPEWITFEGVHFPLIGALAFLYRGFKWMDGEAKAIETLLPWILEAKIRYEKAVTAPTATASTR